ncbi:MAG: HAD hydrolase family protein [Syntrophaceae bacterium]|nr:HAD hydrolase family protein [Syntrophaceae bacterium]
MKDIKAVALDVDGVLTDGSFYWGFDGEELKKFSFSDIMGVSLGRKAGLIFALISGEDNGLIDRFANKMGITDIYKGYKDKASALRSFAEKHRLDFSEICFMGDDVNDLKALELAGFSAAPANAHASVKSVAKLVTAKSGGNGAVRELIDLILEKKESNKK